jgi:hypothetical protein
LDVYANTNDRYLLYWWPKINFNTEYLQFDSVTMNPIWDDLVFVLEKTEINNVGVLESYSTNPKTTTELSETKGNDILLASYHFRVIHSTYNFTSQIITNVIDLTAVTMTDVSLIDFVINTRGSVVDYEVR